METVNFRWFAVFLLEVILYCQQYMIFNFHLFPPILPKLERKKKYSNFGRACSHMNSAHWVPANGCRMVTVQKNPPPPVRDFVKIWKTKGLFSSL